MRRMGVLILVSLLVACASKLDRDLTDKAPKGNNLEAELDLDQVSFRRIDDASPVKLGEAMRAAGWQYVLLVFGSRGCAICNREARALQDEVIGQHELFVTDAGRSFQIIGVNTDQRLDDRLRAYLARLPFIQWNDPAGAEMLAHFMPPGRRFAVPLTVLVRATGQGTDGIVWRVLPDEASGVSVAEIMRRVVMSLRGEGTGNPGAPSASPNGESSSGGEAGGGQVGGGGGEQPTPGESGGTGSSPGTPLRASQLADALPGRLDFLELQSCSGASTQLGALAAREDLMFVQALRGPCNDSCRQLGQHISEVCVAGLGDGRRCRFVRLVARADCRERFDFVGGEPLFEVFATHFNWAYRPLENPDYSLSLPPVSGPIVMGFAADGRLAVSHEGDLTPAGFDRLVAQMDPKLPARGPDFRFYNPVRGEFRFADLRRQARYTVVNAFSTICSSCIAELKHWSRPGNLVDFCAERPDECQIVAVERTDDLEPTTGLPGTYNRVVSTLAAEGIRVPVLLDPTPLDDYLGRFFDGYVAALKPEWGGLFGTLVYDREGKVVTSFAPADESASRADEALEYLRQILR